VVKGFNNIYVDHLATLARPTGDPDCSTLTIAGDDYAAKQTVTQFLDAIGYDTLDVGPLAEGWRLQRGTSAYVSPYAVPGTTYPDWSARPTTPDMLRVALEAARRYRDM